MGLPGMDQSLGPCGLGLRPDPPTCWAKMMSLGRKLATLACHLTKFVNKAE